MNNEPSSSVGLSTIARTELHHRRIDMRGYSRTDGLFEIECTVVDRKPYFYDPGGGARAVEANQPIHDLGVKLVFDESMVVREVFTFIQSAPYQVCQDGGLEFQSLKGLSMTKGWTKEVRARLSGAHACTHLRELLIPMATAAYQSLSMWRRDKPERLDATGKPVRIDSCYAYGAQRDVVRTRYPKFYLAPEQENT